MASTRRNAPCPCGSGEKYRKCCGALAAAAGRPTPAPAAQSTTGLQTAPHALQQDAQARDAQVAIELGLRLLTATDGSRDPGRGMRLIKQAALAGHASGAALAATLAGTSLWRSRDWGVALDYLLLAAKGGHPASVDALRLLAAGPESAPLACDKPESLRAAVDMTSWLAPPVTKQISASPHILIIENFTPPGVCDWLIKQARNRLQRATIYDSATGGTAVDRRRLNSQCDLDLQYSGLLTFILRARISAVSGRPEPAMEIPKLLHYAPGETFTEHCDYLDPAEPAYGEELSRRGQRAQTFLLYLNDDFSGGETHFPALDLHHRGKRGDALLFSNLDPQGSPDPNSRHAGLPPTSGEKWLFSQWIRELPRS